MTSRSVKKESESSSEVKNKITVEPRDRVKRVKRRIENGTLQGKNTIQYIYSTFKSCFFDQLFIKDLFSSTHKIYQRRFLIFFRFTTSFSVPFGSETIPKERG
jgi:hypothetical protein